jgi:hypothetical protein
MEETSAQLSYSRTAYPSALPPLSHYSGQVSCSGMEMCLALPSAVIVIGKAPNYQDHGMRELQPSPTLHGTDESALIITNWGILPGLEVTGCYLKGILEQIFIPPLAITSIDPNLQNLIYTKLVQRFPRDTREEDSWSYYGRGHGRDAYHRSFSIRSSIGPRIT